MSTACLRRAAQKCKATSSVSRGRLAQQRAAAYYSTSQSGEEERGRDSASSTPTTPTRVHGRTYFSGIQPTGVPHLGNYLGALQNWVKLQHQAAPDDELIFSVVGWHALTLPQDRKALFEAQKDILAILLAIGIDPLRCILFYQNHNSDHLELAWLLNCITPTGKLRRMTTWKARLADSRNANDESEVDESLLNVGLFTYPVLQAADILVYKATHVPVGEDQQQHIELCRDLADIFNRQLKDETDNVPLFPLPRQLFTPSKRILSLRDPSSKMSKSTPDVKSRILLTDTPEEIRDKIRSAVTDSIQGITYDPVNRPGTSNLLTILAACEEADPAEVARRYSGKHHGHLKADVTDAVVEMLRRPRAELLRLREDPGYLADVGREGAEKAKMRSRPTMQIVRERLGLL